MKSKVLALATAVGSFALFAVVAPSASAAPYAFRHDGITVSLPRTVTAWDGGTAAVRPTLHVVSGWKRVISSHTTKAFQNGHLVASKPTVHLRAGTYGITERVVYRRWHWVTKTRTVQVRHYPEDGGPYNTDCKVLSLDDIGWPHMMSCTSVSYPGQTLSLDFNGPYSCPDLPADDNFYVGQILHHNICANFKPYYTTEKQSYRVKQFSAPFAFTIQRRSLTVLARRSAPPPPPPATHACTLTSTGHCIQGGEFCPQADYGMTGYDANGVAWVCQGDTTHPHWE